MRMSILLYSSVVEMFWHCFIGNFAHYVLCSRLKKHHTDVPTWLKTWFSFEEVTRSHNDVQHTFKKDTLQSRVQCFSSEIMIKSHFLLHQVMICLCRRLFVVCFLIINSTNEVCKLDVDIDSDLSCNSNLNTIRKSADRTSLNWRIKEFSFFQRTWLLWKCQLQLV